MAKNDDKQVRCSFCGKREGQVKRLIAGPGVFICDECIDLCAIFYTTIIWKRKWKICSAMAATAIFRS